LKAPPRPPFLAPPAHAVSSFTHVKDVKPARRRRRAEPPGDELTALAAERAVHSGARGATSSPLSDGLIHAHSPQQPFGLISEYETQREQEINNPNPCHPTMCVQGRTPSRFSF